MESVFIDGRDPNDACADPLVAQCTSPPLQDGTYQVHYGEDLFDITIPGVAEPTCDEI